jgi:hypothetical protein
MMLAVTLKAPIQVAFGSDGYAQIRSAIDMYVQNQGGKTLALDDPTDTALIRIPPALSSDAGSLLIAIRSAVGAVAATTSLLLMGNEGVIPFFSLPNPVADRNVDPDGAVPSDNPYGSSADTQAQYLAPPLPVGRIPFPVSGSAADALTYLEGASAYKAMRLTRSGSAVITNADWFSFTQSAAASLPGPVDFHVSPGYQLTDPSSIQRGFAYANLHGFSGDGEWKGYDAVQGQFFPVVSPGILQSQTLSGSVVFAENCYGAQIAGRSFANSCALALARQGAAFIGASGLAFGSFLSPRMFLQDADALASSFFSECAAGATVGSALAKARSDYLSGGSPPDAFKQKTLLQFLLLGDPTWN